MGRPQRISRKRVVEVAIKLLDEEGVQALSLERIANELGVRGPSLYHYYPDKSAILDDVAQHILGRVPLGDDGSQGWEEWMVGVALELYRRVMRHPNVAHLVLEHMSPSAVIAGFARGAAMLELGGVPRSRQQLVLQGPHFIMWGLVMHQTVLAVHPQLQEPIDERKWPALAHAIAADRSTGEELLERAVRAYFAGAVASEQP